MKSKKRDQIRQETAITRYDVNNKIAENCAIIFGMAKEIKDLIEQSKLEAIAECTAQLNKKLSAFHAEFDKTHKVEKELPILPLKEKLPIYFTLTEDLAKITPESISFYGESYKFFIAETLRAKIDTLAQLTGSPLKTKFVYDATTMKNTLKILRAYSAKNYSKNQMQFFIAGEKKLASRHLLKMADPSYAALFEKKCNEVRQILNGYISLGENSYENNMSSLIVRAQSVLGSPLTPEDDSRVIDIQIALNYILRREIEKAVSVFSGNTALTEYSSNVLKRMASNLQNNCLNEIDMCSIRLIDKSIKLINEQHKAKNKIIESENMAASSHNAFARSENERNKRLAEQYEEQRLEQTLVLYQEHDETIALIRTSASSLTKKVKLIENQFSHKKIQREAETLSVKPDKRQSCASMEFAKKFILDAQTQLDGVKSSIHIIKQPLIKKA